MKIIRIIASIIMLSISITQAQNPKIETTPIASKPLGAAIWDFEFKNKDAAKVYLTVENNGRTLLKKFAVKTYSPLTKPKESDYGYVRLTGLDLNKETKIIIYVYEHQNYAFATYTAGGNGKTIYVTWEQASSGLRPQSGKGIFTKTTQSGLPLKNNVTSQDLKRFEIGR